MGSTPRKAMSASASLDTSEATPPPAALRREPKPPGTSMKRVRAVTTFPTSTQYRRQDGACSGMTTYRLEVTLSGGATNVYAMFGEDEAHPLDLPPAYQAPEPFGVDVGGVNPVLFDLTSGEIRPRY